MSFRKKLLYKLSPTFRISQINSEKLLTLEAHLNSLRDMMASSLNHVDTLSHYMGAQFEGINNRIANVETVISNVDEEFVKSNPSQQTENFSGHYELWRIKRVSAIVDYFGEGWFQGKKILELGCGYGDIGYVFQTLGADVVFVEGRKSHCDHLRTRFPEARVYQVNLEDEWPFSTDERFDLILHMGLLYHLNDYTWGLEKCAAHTDRLVLETEVCDSSEDYVLRIEEDGSYYDQSLISKGTRPSETHVESILERLGLSPLRIKDARCNAGIHKYDWQITDSKNWESGLRRFWFCEKK